MRTPAPSGAEPAGPIMVFNIPIALTWLRIVLIPVFVGVYYLPDSVAVAGRRKNWIGDDHLRAGRDHRLARRLPRAQAGARPARSARSSIRSPTS